MKKRKKYCPVCRQAFVGSTKTCSRECGTELMIMTKDKKLSR